MGRYKQSIIDLFLENQDFVDLVLPNPVTGYDIDTQLFGSDTIKDSSGNLMFEGQVFPYYYTDGTNEKAKTFVLVDTIVREIDNSGNFKTVLIFVYEFTHKSLVKLSSKEKAKYKQKGYSGVCRTDILATVIDNILNKSTVFGIRELRLKTADIFKPTINEYYGRVLTYNAKCQNTGGDRCGN